MTSFGFYNLKEIFNAHFERVTLGHNLFLCGLLPTTSAILVSLGSAHLDLSQGCKKWHFSLCQSFTSPDVMTLLIFRADSILSGNWLYLQKNGAL